MTMRMKMPLLREMRASGVQSRPLLEFPAGRSHLRRLTVGEYHLRAEAGLVPERTELLEGLVFEKMARSPLHEGLTHELFLFFQNGLKSRDFLVRKEAPLTFAESEPEPDLSIVRGRSPRDFFKQHPARAELIVEVAVSNPEVDRAKGRIYAAAGVREYWVVSGPDALIEVYTHPDRNTRQYNNSQTFAAGTTIQTIEGLSLAVASLFA